MEVDAIRTLGTDELRHGVNIFHDLDGLAEGKGVDFLGKVWLDVRHAGAVVHDVVDLVGLVDISHADFFIGEEEPRQAEGLPDLLELPDNVLVELIRLSHVSIPILFPLKTAS